MQRFATRSAPLFLLFAVLAAPGARAATNPCDFTPQIATPPDLTDVCNGSSPMDPLKDFDTLAWLTFTRLVWPASPSMRGEPDPKAKITDPNRLLTFETLKPEWEIFHEYAAKPEPWEKWPSAAEPCSNHPPIKPGALVLGAFSEFGNIWQPGHPSASANALAAQNHTFVRYLAAFNEIEFNVIINGTLYDPANVGKLPPDLPANSPALAPDGALTIKTAWVEFKDTDPPDQSIDPKRFFTREAWVQNPDPKNRSCRLAKVALVGMHIVHRTKSRPDWIWATFEQIDNVPDPSLPARPHYTFNTGLPGSSVGNTPPPEWQFPNLRPDPHNLTRRQVIENDTRSINAAWQDAFEKAGSVWQYYRLIMTQWPRATKGPVHAVQALPAPPCVGTVKNSATANITMEPFFQQMTQCYGGELTCLTCHDVAYKTDFVFSILLRPRPRFGHFESLTRTQTITTLEDLIGKLRSLPEHPSSH